jgi:hypothetical protein
MANISISDRKIVVTGSPAGSLVRERPDYVAIETGEYSDGVSDDWGNPTDEPITEEPDGSGYVEDLGPDVFKLYPPTDIRVESQTVKIAPDGSSRIDLLLSFEDAPNAIKYEARVTKE